MIRRRLVLMDRASSPPMTCPPPAYRPRLRGMVGAGAQYPGGRGARGRRRAEPRTPAPPLQAVVIQNLALEPYDDIKFSEGAPELLHASNHHKDEEVHHPKEEEGNLVTIVHTGEESSPSVIVTVSGSIPEERTATAIVNNQSNLSSTVSNEENSNHTSEIDILAHL